MRWKEFSYWLRGGIVIGFILFALFLILQVYANATYTGWEILGNPIALVILNILNSLIILKFFTIPNLPPILSWGSDNLFISYIIAIASFFIIGAVIGWVYGKIKKNY